MFNNDHLNRIRKVLTEKKEKISVAESVTSGYLQAAFASAEQAMQFFEGGVTAYNIDQKVNLLKIDRKTGEACNCVSEQTAVEMATGAAKLFNTDWAISVTGFATPVPESDFLRFAYYSIFHKGKIAGKGKLESDEEDQAKVQLYYVNTILGHFSTLLEK